MKTILRIMKSELQILFFSPIAWLILFIFTLQLGISFSEIYEEALKIQGLGYRVHNATYGLIAGYKGVFVQMLNNLYLYIPLLTMGLISRELGSGSIKLLYSSPVLNYEIIIGKYLSVVIYGLLLVATLILPTFFITKYVKDPDNLMMLTAAFGVFITICVYASIGLFMSTITRYQVVAVISTLIVLAILNFIGNIGQEIDFVRDITYWLSISNRSKVFLSGMLSTKDIIYFSLIIFMFLSLSIIRLRELRLKKNIAQSILSYTTVIGVVFILGYISSLPKFTMYYDSSRVKINTLTTYSQDILNKVNDGLTITTYVNILDETWNNGSPRTRNRDLKRFEQYVRFKPELKLKYVYYYGKGTNKYFDSKFENMSSIQRFDTISKLRRINKNDFISEKEVFDQVDISEENGRMVRVIERENGRKAILRLFKDNRIYPTEKDITTTIKTLVQKAPLIAFIEGHDERCCYDMSEKGYGGFASDRSNRNTLINQGFNIKKLSLNSPIPIDVDIIVIADSKSHFSEKEINNYKKYVERGGNVLILGEPRRQKFMNPLIEIFGLKFKEGVVVNHSEEYPNDVIFANFREANELGNVLSQFSRGSSAFTLPSVCAIESFEKNKLFTIDHIAMSPPEKSWIEINTTNFLNEKPTLDKTKGEIEESNSIMYYVKRNISGKEQKIIIIGDSDCFSSKELASNRASVKSTNFNIINTLFYNFSDGEFPININRINSPDTRYTSSEDILPWMKLLYIWLIPISILTIGIFLLMKRRRN